MQLRALPFLALSPSFLTTLAAAHASASPPSGPVAPAVGRGEQQTQVDFEAVARACLESHGAETTALEELDFEAFVRTRFLRLQLGLFDVRFPRTGVADHADRLVRSCAALAASQALLLDWFAPLEVDQKQVRADFKAVERWIKGWKEKVVAKIDAESSPDLKEALGAKEEVLLALDRLREAMVTGSAFGVQREQGASIRLYLMPTRKGFYELVALTGWVREDLRESFWLESAIDWAHGFVDQDQIIALEHPIGARRPGEYAEGTGMNENDPTGMQQQLVQLAMNSLFDAYYAGRVPAAFVQGLSMNLVIDVYGHVDTRVDGDVRSRQTHRREVFVPGGASSGGLLPKNSAETRWRELRGEDHFVGILRLSQKEGRELVKRPEVEEAVFGLRSDSGGERHPAVAPFLGPAAAAREPVPAEFEGDFQELLRCYKSAFIHWLQSAAGGSKKQSAESFAALLMRLAEGWEGEIEDFGTVFSDVYGGKPLSDQTASKDSLEGSFLLWLSKQ